MNRETIKGPADIPADVLNAIFANTNVGMAIGSIEGKIIHCNHAFCSLVGYSHTELTAMTFSQLTHPLDKRNEESRFKEMAESGKILFRLEKRYIRKDGSLVWVDVTICPVKNQKDETVLFAGTAVDISHAKETINSMEFIEKSRRTIGGLLNHEIRGPLTSLSSVFSGVKLGQVSQREFDSLIDLMDINFTNLKESLDNLIGWSDHHITAFPRRRHILDLSLIISKVIKKSFLGLRDGEIFYSNPQKRPDYFHGDRDHVASLIEVCLNYYILRRNDYSICRVYTQTLPDRTVIIDIVDTGNPFHEETFKAIKFMNDATMADSYHVYSNYGLDVLLAFQAIKYCNGHVKITVEGRSNKIEIFLPEE